MKTILALIAALALSSVTVAQTIKLPPIATDAVYDFKAKVFELAVHTSPWQYQLTPKVDVEEWLLISSERKGVSLGTGFVLGFAASPNVSLFGGIVGKVQAGQFPASGLVVGIKIGF